MAKGKRAVALFEVIRSDKRFQKRSPETGQAPPADAPAEASRQMALQAVDLLRKRRTDPEKWSFPKPKFGNLFSSLITRLKSAGSWVRQSSAASANLAHLARAKTNGLLPGAAVAALFISLMLLARHFVHPSVPAPTVEQALRNGPAHPDVLAIGPDLSVTSQAQPSELETDERQAADQQPPAPSAVSTLAQPGQRIVNMHYVLMQSYFEQKTAEDARDFLTKNGIPCTIERGIKGWRPDFYQVIGLQGFVRASGPEYVAYRQLIESLGSKFSPKSKYKRFQPEAIKW